MIRRYSELIRIPTFQERFEYAKCGGSVGVETFGEKRYLNQTLYSSPEWRRVRRNVIIRDGGFDLAHEDYPIPRSIHIHHLNPITADDILERNPCLFDLENLVCVGFQTHNAIHYGSGSFSDRNPIVRSRNDTCPWK